MSFFLVRVELHKGASEDYDKLHSAMQKAGFHVRVTDKGKTFHLPTAEYAVNSERSTSQILEAAKQAAITTRKEFCAVIVKCAEFEQFNLTQSATA